MIVKVQDYNIDIKPTNLVGGKGLCKLIVKNKREDDLSETKNFALVVSVGLKKTILKYCLLLLEYLMNSYFLVRF